MKTLEKKIEEVINELESSLIHKDKIKGAVVIYCADHFDSGGGFNTLDRFDEHFMLVDMSVKKLQTILKDV